ncbi:MAG: AmmeMemoRadiSam system protein B [Bacteroidales bacterium]|nr:AmmeMemoRadiSam system protein B [Bacteroidales bacterium]
MSLLSFNQAAGSSKDKDAKVRPMAVVGSFYPAQKDSIKKLMDSYFASYAKIEAKEQIAAVIVPHAGYIFSGAVAASAFAQIPTDSKFDHIFLIGPSHHVYLDGASINSEFDYYATPLGDAKVDIELCKQLIRDHHEFVYNAQAHQKEHCLEVQLPFLQYRMKEMAPIVPIIIGTQSLPIIERIATILKPYFNEKNLFVISSDFSHYPSYADAKEVDERTGRAIENGKLDEFMDTLEYNKNQRVENLATSACGQSAIALLLYLTQQDKNIQINHLLYRNSGDSQYGGKEEVVGYHAFTFVRKKEIEAKSSFTLSEKEKHALLNIARNSILNELNRQQEPSYPKDELSETLKMKCGAFVTLYEDGHLRGCIGHFNNDTPLYRIIEEMAKAAAFQDPRFMPVHRSELDEINIEISVLSPLKKIRSINEFDYGKEGIYISKGGRSGTFLPQVAQETNWTKEEFLGHCARDKAGLSWDGWKNAELYTYEAIIFKEEKQ